MIVSFMLQVDRAYESDPSSVNKLLESLNIDSWEKKTKKDIILP